MALGLQVLAPETTGGRIAGVFLAVLVLLVTLYFANRWYSVSFFNGFLVAVGIFLSFDLFLVHWMMELHRVTSGDEAIWLEIPLFVAGLTFIVVGVRRERQLEALDRTHTSNHG